MLVYQEARARARTLLEALNESEPQVDLGAVCEMYDLEVYYTDTLPSGLSGMIVKEKDEDGASIFINSSHSSRRQRFTLAHEIGHYVERVEVAGDRAFSFEDRRGQHYDLHEFFADEFAGALLMPETMFLADVENGLLDEKLAAKYGVSTPAVERRKMRLAQQQTAG